MNLDDLLELGYEETVHYFAGYRLYKKDDSRILYDEKKEVVFMEYNIRNLESRKKSERSV